MRNYKAMKDEKLVRELESGAVEGDEYQVAMKEAHLRGLSFDATAESVPSFKPIKPMLAKGGEFPKNTEGWSMEWKLDGWRNLAVRDENGVTCYTRTGKVMSSLPYINDAILDLPVGTILDGEVVDLAAKLGEEWNRTQKLCSRDSRHLPSDDNPALTFMVFDVLEYCGVNLRGSTQINRSAIAEEAVEKLNSDYIKVIERVQANEAGYQQLVEGGAEGVVLKYYTGKYVDGKRSPDWLKIKPILECDAVITGTYPAAVGSKYDGSHAGGITFKLANGVEGKASGMDDQLREDLFIDPASFVGRIVELHYGGVGDDGALRFPRFKRLRDAADKESL